MSKQDDFHTRYMAAAHAIQTGVAYTLEYDPSSGTPKHLRTGLDLRAAEHGALARLLIAKGVFTEDEYLEAIVLAVEEEKRAYEERLKQHYGGKTKITLG